MEGDAIKRVKNFKYLGSTISRDGRCEEEVRRMIQAGWMGRKKISGVVSDRKLSAKIKGKMYQSVIRLANGHAQLNGNCGDDRKTGGKMEVAKLKMAGWALCVTRKQARIKQFLSGEGQKI